MTEKFSVKMQVESYELVNLNSQVKRNLKDAIEKDPRYRCVKIAVKTAKHLGGSV